MEKYIWTERGKTQIMQCFTDLHVDYHSFTQLRLVLMVT